LLKRAKFIAPGCSDVLTRLGQLYRGQLYGADSEAVKGLAALALVEFEEVLVLEQTVPGRMGALRDAALSAADAGDLAKAERLATDLLTSSTEMHERPALRSSLGMATHYGHIVLGRVALARGDIKSAKNHLEEAGKSVGAPSLNTGGPNMSLAKPLLESGEREAVIAFLQDCTKFWENPYHRAEQWIDQIQRGHTPDLSANLYI
jgi:hypothetical protein